MESISIPINILYELAGNTITAEKSVVPPTTSTTTVTEDIILTNSTCLDGPILLYYNKKCPLLFVILENIIPLLVHNSNTGSNNNNNKKKNRNVKLHPMLEEFMILSANEIESNYNYSNDDEITPHDTKSSNNNDNNGDDQKETTSIPVWIQYINQPLFYSDSFFTKQYKEMNYGNNNQQKEDDINNNSSDNNNISYYFNDEPILQCHVSKQQFYLQHIQHNNIHDLKSIAETTKIKLTLEFIYCSNKDYENVFLEMGKLNWCCDNDGNIITTTNNNDDNNNDNNHNYRDHDDETKMDDKIYDQQQQNSMIMYQYVHKVLCQALEYKVVKEGMILPLILPPFPNNYYNGSEDDDYDEDDIVAFFKLKLLHIKNTSNEYRELDTFYRIGALYSFAVEGHIERNNKNIISIQISLPPCHENKEGNNTDNHDEPYSMNGGQFLCPGYEGLVDEIVSMSKIRIESGAPTGILLTGCTGVGKTTLVSIFSVLNDSAIIKWVIIGQLNLFLCIHFFNRHQLYLVSCRLMITQS